MVKDRMAADYSQIGRGLDVIEGYFNEKKINRKRQMEAMLLSEESMAELIDNASENSEIRVYISRTISSVKIKLTCPGKEFRPHAGKVDFDVDDDEDGESQEAIRNLLIQSYSDRVKYAHNGKINIIEITSSIPESVRTLWTMAIFAAAIIFGLIFKFFCSESFCDGMEEYVLYPIETIFINCLKLTVAPMMFLSIITNIAQYTTFSRMSKANIKIIISFVLTSVLAVCVGVLTFRLFSPGTVGELSEFIQQVTEKTTMVNDTVNANTVVDIIVGIFPDNFIEPFLKANALQLIFIALVCGFALGRAGKYSSPLQSGARALGELCKMFANIITRIIPVAVFVSTISLVINTKTTTLLSMLKMIATLLAALATMICFYLLAILVWSRLNPITFLKKYAPTMKYTFFEGSAVAAVPKTISCCKNKLGISDKISSFAIPFGAMANMDGNCIYLTISCLFMARVCGLEIGGANMIPLIFSIVVLSIGAPIAAGSVLICMSAILSQMGISMTALCLILGINTFVEMLLAMCDTLGDVAVALTVAKEEKELDIEMFNAK